jgi:hypothetical protein
MLHVIAWAAKRARDAERKAQKEDRRDSALDVARLKAERDDFKKQRDEAQAIVALDTEKMLGMMERTR